MEVIYGNPYSLNLGGYIYLSAWGWYYEKCGFRKSKRNADNWMKTMTRKLSDYNTQSPKTTNLNKFQQYVNEYISVYDEFWKLKLKKKWAQQNLRVYIKKQKVLDNFFQSMVGLGLYCDQI